MRYQRFVPCLASHFYKAVFVLNTDVSWCDHGSFNDIGTKVTILVMYHIYYKTGVKCQLYALYNYDLEKSHLQG